MSSVDLRAGDDLSMSLLVDALGAGRRVCIALPAPSRDPAACAGLPLEALKPDTAEVVAYVRGGADVLAVSIKKNPGRYNAFEGERSAKDFAKGYLEGAAEGMPAGLHIDEASVQATLVRTADGVNVVSLAYEVSGVDPQGPSRLVAHQRVYAVPTETAMELVVASTSAAAAPELDALATASVPTMHVAHPATSRDYKLGYAIGGVIGTAIPLAIAGGVVWWVLARERAKRRAGER
ncbi:MAG: hypothetical protein ACRELB_05120 [Polyangiaceae bacterium]